MSWSGWVLLHLRLPLACAMCAARPPEGHRTVFFIAAMVLLPFVVGTGAVLAIRRLERGEPGHQERSEEPRR